MGRCSAAALCLKMNSIIVELKPFLIEEGYKFREADKSLFIELPNGFGELQIYDLEENDDIVGLAGSQWHTHSECLGDPDLPRTDKIIEFLSKIFSGQYLLIEEQEPGKKPRKSIEEDLRSYLKWLPKNTTYQVFNKT